MRCIILFSMIVLFSEFATAQTSVDTPHDEPALLVYVDVKPACPRRGCWAATHEALLRLTGVKQVDMEASDSTLRRVEMCQAGLPDPTVWEAQFRDYVGTASEFRGVVITLTGTIVQEKHRLSLEASGIGTVELNLMDKSLKLVQSKAAGEQTKTGAINTDPDAMSDQPTVPTKAMVTGLLKKGSKGYSLAIRQLKLLP